MIRLIDSTGNATGATVLTADNYRNFKRVVQVTITGVATVTIQGRSANDQAWVDIASFDVSDAVPMTVMHQVRAVVTNAEGTAKAKVDLDVERQRGTV